MPVVGADGLVLLEPLRAALSGAGPAVAPHAAGAVPPPEVLAPLSAAEDDVADPVAAVVSTTGSTGTAKHVLLPASALLASAAATHDRLGGAGRWLLAVPAHTVAGLQVVVRSLVAGTRPEVLDLAGGFDPERFVRAGAALAAGSRPSRRYTSLVPTQLQRLLTAGPTAVAALRGFDAVLVGGAALDDRLREQAERAGVAVVTTYGMTETCGGCVYDGVPLPGVQVEVVPLGGADEPGGTPAAPAEPVGRVVVAGPVVARGYRGRGPSGESERDGEGEGFVPRGADGPARFRTADRGRLEQGRLVLHGRTDDVVVSGGANVSLDAVTRCVRGLAGVADALAVAVPDAEWGHRVAVLVQPGPGRTPPGADAVRAAVRERLGRAAAPRTVVVVGAVPLTGVGKPDRAAAARLVPGHPDAPGPAGLRDHGDLTSREPEEPTT